ncbi:galactose mutarotase-like isoform X2 [Haliotis rufescens]|uniref:galactose mutarotase-like isoform X2 n=1 Tax=Haliotis rufescens TaxID=6454 RepID=UPI001EB05BC0|nr:galactose mutarotase-like isoform X2 [Haliotis rufescens]
MAPVTEEEFGKTEAGENVSRYTLTNNNVLVRVLNYGATITDILVPDKHGNVDDISLGFDDITGYQDNTPYIGTVIGRVANRIAGAKFSLDGKTYNLAANHGSNFIHGGVKGFNKVVWTANVVDGKKLQLRYVSDDGEEGFPGEVTTTVTYELTDDNQLFIQYEARTTKTTPINLTNHAYFNMAGHSAGHIDDHVVRINSDAYAVLDDTFIPTGEIKDVAGTPYDLRSPVRLGDHMTSVPGEKGYTVSYNLEDSGTLKHVARVEHPPSGRVLEMSTTEPSVMFYTSYYLDATGKGGATYGKFGAFCLEAQHHPDSVNQPSFPCTVLRPGETYRQTTVYRFSVDTQ